MSQLNYRISKQFRVHPRQKNKTLRGTIYFHDKDTPKLAKRISKENWGKQSQFLYRYLSQLFLYSLNRSRILEYYNNNTNESLLIFATSLIEIITSRCTSPAA